MREVGDILTIYVPNPTWYITNLTIHSRQYSAMTQSHKSNENDPWWNA